MNTSMHECDTGSSFHQTRNRYRKDQDTRGKSEILETGLSAYLGFEAGELSAGGWRQKISCLSRVKPSGQKQIRTADQKTTDFSSCNLLKTLPDIPY